jgi:hypothetical protein
LVTVKHSALAQDWAAIQASANYLSFADRSE